MSSLLKMNQKFLSKSSWSIRSNSNSNNNNNNSGNQRSSVPYSVNKFVLSPLNHHQNNKYVAITTNSNNVLENKRRPNMTDSIYRVGNTNGRMQFGAGKGDNKQLTDDCQSTPVNKAKHNQNQLIYNSTLPHYVSDIGNSQTVFGNHNSPLKRSKGMSLSITDLRELNPSDESDIFQHEINERRIDMYIAEIEMEPLFQLGSTIRYIYLLFSIQNFVLTH